MSILDDTELYDRYDNALDDDGPVTIAGLKLYPSAILKATDPIAYRTGYSDWLDAETGETIWEMPSGEYTDDEDDLNRVECSQCGELTDADDIHHGMCPSCVYNARRSGWEG